MQEWIAKQETEILEGLYQYLSQVVQFRTLTSQEDQFRQAIETEIAERVQNLINQ